MRLGVLHKTQGEFPRNFSVQPLNYSILRVFRLQGAYIPSYCDTLSSLPQREEKVKKNFAEKAFSAFWQVLCLYSPLFGHIAQKFTPPQFFSPEKRISVKGRSVTVFLPFVTDLFLKSARAAVIIRIYRNFRKGLIL